MRSKAIAIRACNYAHDVRPGSSLKLRAIFGIRVGVNASWFFVLFLFIFVLGRVVRGHLATRSDAFVVAVAAAVLLLRLDPAARVGHALAARREGIEVGGIDLFFFGGVMKMSRDTDSPGARSSASRSRARW